MPVAGINECKRDSILHICIYYKQGCSDYDPCLNGNADALKKLILATDNRLITDISVISSASPEGNTELNRSLSEARSMTALGLLQNIRGYEYASKNIESIGTDWIGLATKVSESDMEYADEADSLIRNTPEWIMNDSVIVDSRKLRLKLLRDNRPWQYMSEYIFPELRVSHIYITHCDRCIIPPLRRRSTTDELTSSTSFDQKEIIEPNNLIYKHEKRSSTILLTSNMLYNLAAVPNLGAELIFANGWATGFSGMYAWWNKGDLSKVWRIQGGEIIIKRYMGNHYTPSNNWHIGVYANIFRYDIHWGKKGYLSGNSGGSFFNRSTFGAGFEGGYTLKLSEKFCLDFSLGIGYLAGQYLTYKTVDTHNVWESTRRRHWFGPTKAEISLVWIIAKGGRR